MNNVWYFYPENDIALAHNLANFTPPPAATALRLSGEILPLWLASEGDSVMCSGVNARWYDDIRNQFSLPAVVWDHAAAGQHPRPWGWSRAVREVFRNAGFPDTALPSDRALDRMRLLSHRRTALRLHAILAAKLQFPLWPCGTEVSDSESLEKQLHSEPFSVLKAPWSSSGRGIHFCDASRLPQILKQAAGIIRRQGSVIVEPRARRITDFAMLYIYNDGRASFSGYSLFTTNDSGHYTSNIVDTPDAILARLSAVYPSEHLEALRDAVADALPAIIGEDYSGPIGIDMMIVESPDGGAPLIHPVVEINLRYTMGFVAHALAGYVSAPATFTVCPAAQAPASSPTVTGGRLTAGVLHLTPPGGDFAFILQIAPEN